MGAPIARRPGVGKGRPVRPRRTATSPLPCRSCVATDGTDRRGRGRTMMLCIPEVLTRAELERLRTALAGAEFADGKATTGYRARRVKNNLQLARDNAVGKEIAPLIEQALWRNETFGWAVWPKQIRGILFSRYEPGMGYGNHVDNAIMGKASLWRSDVAFTIFLADPADYEGGELVIESPLGVQEVKL